MDRGFEAGDFLIFQIESAFGLLRILAIDSSGPEHVWHLAAYNEMFLDIDAAEEAVREPSKLTLSYPHLAITNRAFESTQTSRLAHTDLTAPDLAPYEDWKLGRRGVSDTSVRLLLGLR
jgi:hypothetical protein